MRDINISLQVSYGTMASKPRSAESYLSPPVAGNDFAGLERCSSAGLGEGGMRLVLFTTYCKYEDNWY